MKRDNPCMIAQRMKDRRNSLGKKTQRYIADKTGLSVKTINNLEHMTAPTLSVDTFIKLCDALECSADYLLGKDDLPTHELSDIHTLTGLSEDAIDTLMHRRIEASSDLHHCFDKVGYLMLADFISYVISHFDNDLLLEYIDSTAISNIYKDIISDEEEHNHNTSDELMMGIISNQKLNERSARCTKMDLGNKYMTNLEEWVKGVIDEYTELLLEKRDSIRK